MSTKKNMKKKSKRMVEAEEDTVAKIDVDINIDGWIGIVLCFVCLDILDLINIL